MNCSATLNCGELVCFFVHSQDDLPVLCREMEKGISGCSTLTKLFLLGLFTQHLPPQCSSANVRAAMALQSSLTEVKWKCCSFRSKSNIGVTVLACCVLCVHGCVVRDRGRGGRDCVCVCEFACICRGVHGCMQVCVCLLKCICIVCAHHL